MSSSLASTSVRAGGGSDQPSQSQQRRINLRNPLKQRGDERRDEQRDERVLRWS